MAPETDPLALDHLQRLKPSMRPGQDGPGNGATGWTPWSGDGAFNEAGARWPRKPVRAYQRAVLVVRPSMRPGQDGPGNLVEDVPSPYLSAPSMRPGQDGPGNEAKTTVRTEAFPPSMRPGQDGPGNRERC